MVSIRGIAYPLAVVNGGLAVSTDIDLIKQQIHSCLETREYERVMQPFYGTSSYVFDGISNPAVIASQLQNSLETQIFDVEFAVTANYLEAGILMISVGWSVGEIPQPAIEYKLIQ